MNFEIGDRCIVTRSEAGNEGKICEVTGFMTDRTFIGLSWSLLYTLIITSLGSPFNYGSVDNSEFGTNHMVPAKPSQLRKLPTITELELEMETHE